MTVGERLDLVVETVVFRGDGLARHAGQVVFVAGSAPGAEPETQCKLPLTFDLPPPRVASYSARRPTTCVSTGGAATVL